MQSSIVEIDPADDEQTRALVGISFGSLLMVKGDLDVSVGEFRNVLRLGISERMPALGHAELGNALLLKGKTDAAIAEFRQAVSINPTNADARLSLGRLLAIKGDLSSANDREGAIVEFGRGIRFNPSMTEGHLKPGALLYAHKRD